MGKSKATSAEVGTVSPKVKVIPIVSQREHDHLKRRVLQLEKAQDHLRRTGQHLEL